MTEIINLLGSRITNVMYFVIMFLLIERNFKRKNREHFFYITFDSFDTPFLPCPYLWRDIVIDWNIGILLYKLCNAKIESRIVNEDNRIRLPTHDVLLAHLHILEDSGQMQQYRNEPHIGKFTIMLHTCTPHFRHQITTKEAKLSLWIILHQRLHKA